MVLAGNKQNTHNNKPPGPSYAVFLADSTVDCEFHWLCPKQTLTTFVGRLGQYLLMSLCLTTGVAISLLALHSIRSMVFMGLGN